MTLRIRLRLPLPAGIAAQLASRAAQDAAFVELVNARLGAEVARIRQPENSSPATPWRRITSPPPTGNA